MIDDSKEKLRIEAVERYKGIYLSRERELHDIVEILAEICQMPIAMITLIDNDHQLIKHKVGALIDKTSRKESFCSLMVHEGKTLQVEDTTKDARFKNMKWVKGKNGIKFYAGTPLTSRDGFHIGSLCVYDRKINKLSEKQLKIMETLSRQASHLLELELSLDLLNEHFLEIQKQKDKTEKTDLKLRSFFESFTSCYVLLDKHMVVLDFNEAMANFISDIDKGNLQLDSVFSDFLSPAYRENFYKNFMEALDGNRIQEELSLEYINLGEIWWKITFAPMLGKEKQVTGVSVNCVNINERKNHELKILKQNQSLLKIAHMQSHEFRKPVASIKGIMQLIKADNYLPDLESLLQMERAVQELDEKILEVIMLSKTYE
ncbi:GAF domain-containing protein [Pedobacter sp. L105]|uniref:GAF domain-containing protein n=1 Tax=Pedobacter sp. L105 TaxID=1641871 RepID=UPI00131EA76F|nr:GAF domain-containing protein [Pedobacter sp. L105]